MAEENNQEQQTVRLFGDVFLYDSIIKKSKCIWITNGKQCGTYITTNRPYNLKRHLKHCHKDLNAKIIDNDCKTFLTSSFIYNCCVEMLTINGRPFSSLLDSGFLKLTKPLLDYIEQINGEKINITIDAVKSHMNNISSEIRQHIMNETKGLLVSVMIDTATRCNRAILGINIQYVIDGRIVVRTLKMLRLTESHTGKSLAHAVIDTLKEFNINACQIYSQTTDNGANVLLSTKLLDELVEAEKNASAESALTFEEVEEEFYMELLKEAEREFFNNPNVPENVAKLSCGEHTFQLAFNDALKATNPAMNLIEKVKNIAKKLRTPNILNALKEKKLNFPLIDNDTRWTGKYRMVRTVVICLHDCLCC